MTITKKTIKDPPEFCFTCGKQLDKEEYVLNLGTSGSTFDLCKSCLTKIVNRGKKVLE